MEEADTLTFHMSWRGSAGEKVTSRAARRPGRVSFAVGDQAERVKNNPLRHAMQPGAQGERHRCRRRLEDRPWRATTCYVKILRAAEAPFRWLASIRAATLANDSAEPTA